MRAEQALDEMSLLKMRLTNPFVRDVIEGWFSSFSSTGSLRIGGKPAHLADAEASRLERADAYFISRDMSALIEHAATLLDESDQFVRDLWPSDAGFVWIDGGFKVHDHSGEVAVIQCLLWSHNIADGVPGMFTTMYASLNDQEDSVSKWAHENYPERVDEMGHVQLAHLGFIGDGVRVGPPEFVTDGPNANEMVMVNGDGSPAHGVADNHMRYILAMLMMFEQEITAKSTTLPNRADGKRWRRADIPDRVTVIALRRTSGAQHGESDVEWAHRWVVRGHWRWQPYGTRSTACDHMMDSPVVENGRRTSHCVKDGCDHRVERIWLSPYIKGPDGAPLKITDKINALVR